VLRKELAESTKKALVDFCTVAPPACCKIDPVLDEGLLAHLRFGKTCADSC
jgi:hypothetical protein